MGGATDPGDDPLLRTLDQNNDFRMRCTLVKESCDESLLDIDFEDIQCGDCQAIREMYS